MFQSSPEYNTSANENISFQAIIESRVTLEHRETSLVLTEYSETDLQVPTTSKVLTKLEMILDYLLPSN